MARAARSSTVWPLASAIGNVILIVPRQRRAAAKAADERS
jgi:hypothetical protein